MINFIRSGIGIKEAYHIQKMLTDIKLNKDLMDAMVKAELRFIDGVEFNIEVLTCHYWPKIEETLF